MICIVLKISVCRYRDLVTFHATDATGHPIYHTNVMMAIGTDVAIVCSESVEDEREREHLLVGGRAVQGLYKLIISVWAHLVPYHSYVVDIPHGF